MCVSQWSLNFCVFVSLSAWALPFPVVFVSCSRSSLLQPLLSLVHCVCLDGPVFPDGFSLWLLGPVLLDWFTMWVVGSVRLDGSCLWLFGLVLPDGFIVWVVLREARSPWFTWS